MGIFNIQILIHGRKNMNKAITKYFLHIARIRLTH